MTNKEIAAELRPAMTRELDEQVAVKVMYDINGVPIHPGDLIRSYHFRDRRRKVWYLYHTATMRDGRMMVVPTSHLEPTKVKGGGSCVIDQRYLDRSQSEVIAGYGPGKYLDHTERPKRPATIPPAGERE